MLFGRILRWTCDARQMDALRRARADAMDLRAARREADELLDVLLGAGPEGPMSLRLLQYMIPAYRESVKPVHRRATAARRRLAFSLRACRGMMIARWQVRLALL